MNFAPRAAREEEMIVVLDSSVWISGLHFGGAQQAALDKAFHL
jgi:hypothetical protein